VVASLLDSALEAKYKCCSIMSFEAAARKNGPGSFERSKRGIEDETLEDLNQASGGRLEMLVFWSKG
jgi:hypothetical protein